MDDAYCYQYYITCGLYITYSNKVGALVLGDGWSSRRKRKAAKLHAKNNGQRFKEWLE